jgi:hypothetical protein
MLVLSNAPFSGTHFLMHLLELSEVPFHLAQLTNQRRFELVRDNEVKLISAIRNPWRCMYSASNRHHNTQSNHEIDRGGSPVPLDDYLNLQLDRMETLKWLHKRKSGFPWRTDESNNYWHLMAYCRCVGTESGQQFASENPVTGSEPYAEPQDLVLSPAQEERVVALCTYWGYDEERPEFTAVERSGPSREDLWPLRQQRELTEEVIQCLNPI